MDRSCNAHQKEIRVEKRSPLMSPPAKRAGRQSAIGVPPGFPPLNSSIGKRLAAELSAIAKKSKPVQESQGSRPGTAKRGQNTLVGFLPEAKFCPRFKRTFTGNPCGSLKIPKVFCQHMIGNFPLKINAFGNT
ncbi:uncharacterized protein LOC124701331 [Lolium rigidum]|uniref:uncharacterized protein LOC124701331 n=1 Tax=Lolium rigidum TaxID=89674 RepID=UPI001F5D7A8D|nr:uncharacterized protein LOC124701331 [Lolium rigidum]XP_047089337.1 uncharacterized protein LOC124701331 [Lolium rigidum]XP_047089338.1 uncharacterized protein LOC124701331 [Lolium rigidum]XP_047089339.1 uncharacterized protein LOC124701331 [Lolium rigidum]